MDDLKQCLVDGSRVGVQCSGALNFAFLFDLVQNLPFLLLMLAAILKRLRIRLLPLLQQLFDYGILFLKGVEFVRQCLLTTAKDLVHLRNRATLLFADRLEVSSRIVDLAIMVDVFLTRHPAFAMGQAPQNPQGALTLESQARLVYGPFDDFATADFIV